jgi:hypothetical protein
MAWAFLETVSDTLLHSILEPNEATVRVLQGKLEMRSRWDTIWQFAKERFSEPDIDTIKGMKRDVEVVSADRNIIVHGEVHASLPNSARRSYWTIWKGANAGKRFPISTEAVVIVRCNVQVVGNRVHAFNEAKGFKSIHGRYLEVVSDWPKRL